MNRILILLASLLLVEESFALPKCPPWHLLDGIMACTHTYANGDKYVGKMSIG